MNANKTKVETGKKPTEKTTKTQSGFVLPVVLVMLVLLTILTVFSLRNVTMEERMAGNMRNQQLAFQTAETSLRYCETMIFDGAYPQFFEEGGKQIENHLPTMGDKGDTAEKWKKEEYWDNEHYAVTVPDDKFPEAKDMGMTSKCMVEMLKASVPKQGSLPNCPFRVTAKVYDGDKDIAIVQTYIIAPAPTNRRCSPEL